MLQGPCVLQNGVNAECIPTCDMGWAGDGAASDVMTALASSQASRHRITSPAIGVCERKIDPERTYSFATAHSILLGPF